MDVIGRNFDQNGQISDLSIVLSLVDIFRVSQDIFGKER
jgi:hypothetical protein